ncbi:MAG: VCBS repeat-containing protein [Thermodesulfobacteriota bacterium]
MKMKKWFFLLCFFLFLGVYGLFHAESGDAQTNPVLLTTGDDIAKLNLTGSRQGQVVGLADFDGDGIADKFVGAPYATIEGSNRIGVVLVYRGNSQGGFSFPPATLLSGGDNFGFSFATLGDVDGDKRNDFAVGALHGDGEDVSLCGTVTIYKGGSKGQIISVLSGEDPLDKFGFSIASGDLDKDGFVDVIVGAPFHTKDPAFYQGGAIYLFLGPDFKRRISLHASKTHQGLGRAVATGDVNGDGISDLLFSSNGKVLGYYGSPAFSPAIDAPDFLAKSSAAGLGNSIAVLEDLDGDGMREMAFGAPGATIDGKASTGCILIVKGGKGKRAIDLDKPSPDLIVRINGNRPFDRLGSSLAVVSEKGCKGTGLAVGASTADAEMNLMGGKVYLFKPGTMDSMTSLTDSTVFGGSARDQCFGTSVVFCDCGNLLVGAPGLNVGTGGVFMVGLQEAKRISEGSSNGKIETEEPCH